MTSADDSAVRRRRVSFRAWHRGTREMDLIMGRFADAELAGMGPDELTAFEALIEQSDTDLYPWVTGQARPPREIDTPCFARLRSFHAAARSYDV